MAGVPVQMNPQALMQAVNAQGAAPNPQTPKDRFSNEDKRTEFYNSARAALKHIMDEGLEEDPDNQAIVTIIRGTLGNMSKNTVPGFTKEQFLKQVGMFGSPALGGGGVPGQPPSPGAGIAGVGMGGPPNGVPPSQPPTAQPPPMVG